MIQPVAKRLPNKLTFHRSKTLTITDPLTFLFHFT